MFLKKKKKKKECRGIILEQDDSKRWNVVALPFTKFFNAEDTRVGEFDWEGSSLEFAEKLDGTMVLLYYYANEWHVASMGVADGTNSLEPKMTLQQTVLRILTAEKLRNLPTNLCFVFELLLPSATIVISHQNAALILIFARKMRSKVGELGDFGEVDTAALGRQLGLEISPRFAFGNKVKKEKQKNLLFFFLLILFVF